MDTAALATRQRDDQWATTPESPIDARIRALLLETHTCLPGIIRSFDAATQTVTAQAALKRQFIVDDGSDGWVELPLMIDVPVVVAGGGDLYLTFPIAAGDECLLHFSERAIDFWWDRGGTQEPSEFRMHDYSDAFAEVGPLSRPRMLDSYSTTAAELRTRDGTTVLSLQSGKIVLNGDAVFIGGEAGAEPAVLGQTLASYLQSIATLLAAHTHPVSGAVAGISVSLASPALDPPTITASKASVL